MSTKTSKPDAGFAFLSADTVLTGLETATIGLSPEDLSDRSGVHWTRDEDELGPSLLAVFRLTPRGPRFALRSYDDAPFPGVILSSDADAEPADIDTVLTALGIEDEEIIDRIAVRAANGAARSTKRPSGTARSARQAKAEKVRAAKPAVRRASSEKPGLSKAALVQAVAANSGLSKDASQRAIESLLDTVTETLGRGEDVSITGFGKFSVSKRAARKGVNPRTGERIKIKASKAPTFTPGETLKRTVARKSR